MTLSFYDTGKPELKAIYYPNAKTAATISPLVKSVSVSGDLSRAWRSCEVELSNTLNGDDTLLNLETGKPVRIYSGKTEVFYGYIFSLNQSDKGDVSLTCYDPNFYLSRNKDSFVFKNKKASDIVKFICARYGLKIGTINDTGYVIPKLILRDKSLWEVIIIALTETNKKNNRYFHLSTSQGAIQLLERKKQITTLYLQNKANIISASYSSSIENIATQVKITGGDENNPTVGIATDKESRSKYGLMQYYEHNSDIKDSKRLNELARTTLNQLKKPEEEFEIEALGVTSVKSGTTVFVDEQISGVTGAFYVAADKHTFNADRTYTMSLSLSKTYDVPMQDYEAPSEEKPKEPKKTTDNTALDTKGKARANSLVLKWRPNIEKYAKQYGVPQYVELLLAQMMQESGGSHADLMQSSESLGLKRNTLKYDASIKQGVKYFAEGLKKGGGDPKLALQAYNFGHGFIPYAKSKGGYTEKVAKDFSAMMAFKKGKKSYGDKYYVRHVMRYYTEL